MTKAHHCPYASYSGRTHAHSIRETIKSQLRLQTTSHCAMLEA